MPSWGIHIYIAKKVSEKLNMFSKDFIIANVLPDIYSGYIIENMPVTLTYDETHYSSRQNINNSSYMLPDFKRFKKEHENFKNNLAVLGYYTHLLTDYFFNYYSFKNKFIKNNLDQIIAIKDKNNREKTAQKEEARVSKQGDFAIFDYVLLNQIDVEQVSLCDKFVLECLKIKSMNICYRDLQKVVDYINDMINNKVKYKEQNKFKDYSMFTEQELYKITNECIEFILSKISN